MNAATVGNLVDQIRHALRSQTEINVNGNASSSIAYGNGGSLTDPEKQLASWCGERQRKRLSGGISTFIAGPLSNPIKCSSTGPVANATLLHTLRSELRFIKNAFAIESILQEYPWGCAILLQLQPSLLELYIEVAWNYPSDQCFLRIAHHVANDRERDESSSNLKADDQLRIVQRLLRGEIRVFKPISVITLVNIINSDNVNRKNS